MAVLPTTPIVRLVAGRVPQLEYRPPTMAQVRWWQDNVQPRITARYPDQGFDKWDWREFARFPGVVLEPDTRSIMQKASAAMKRFLGDTVRLRWRMVGLFHTDDTQPLALIMYMPDVRLRSGAPRLHYLEYFVARPRDQHSFGNTKPFGKFIMDWLMMSSNLAGLDGRVGLHGASESLCTMYEAWGFVRIDGPGSLQMIARSTIPHIRNRVAARASAALFCEIDGERSSKFCAQFNALREPSCPRIHQFLMNWLHGMETVGLRRIARNSTRTGFRRWPRGCKTGSVSRSCIEMESRSDHP